MVRSGAILVVNSVFVCRIRFALGTYGGSSRVLGSDGAGKCLYSIGGNIVRLCCPGLRPCSPLGAVWSVPPQLL